MVQPMANKINNTYNLHIGTSLNVRLYIIINNVTIMEIYLAAKQIILIVFLAM